MLLVWLVGSWTCLLGGFELGAETFEWNNIV